MDHDRLEAPVVLAAAVIVGCVFAAVTWRLVLRSRRAWAVRPLPAAPARGARGFTLVEVLVVIGVIALLIAIILPSLARSKQLSRGSKSLSTERQLMASLAGYAGDYEGMYPFLGTPGDPSAPLSIWGHEVDHSAAIFGAHKSIWASVIVGYYFDAPPQEVEWPWLRDDMSSGIDETPEYIVRSRFWMSHNVLAAAAYWRAGVDWDDLDNRLIHGVRHADVAFPSNKGILLDVSMGFFNPGQDGKWDATLVGVADGSARLIRWGEFDHSRVVYRPFGALAWVVMSTQDGVQGRDF